MYNVDTESLLDNTEEKTYSLLCDPRRWLHRYVLLFFMVFISFGSYFCYDSPGSLQDVMKRDLEISTSQYSLFYSLYSWPNVILCFFGGLLLDKVFGLCWGTIIFSCITTIGQTLFATGALLNKLWLMYLGRFIFGLGGESLSVAQNSYAVSLFHGSALNMVFGLQLSFSRVGSTVGMITNNRIYSYLDKSVHGHTCLAITLFVGSVFCVYSLVCAGVIGFFSKRATRILHDRRQLPVEEETIRFSDIRNFGVPMWLLCGICVSYYVAIFPFISLGLVYFENKYQLDAGEAGVVNSLIYILAAIFSPFMGFCIDSTGRNIVWILSGIILTMLAHGLLAFTFITPYIPVVIMGFAYSILASALWPIVSIIIPKHQIATAYGIMQSIQNLGLAVVMYWAGKLVDLQGYLMVEILYLLFLSVSLFLTISLYIWNNAKNLSMNFSARQRRAHVEAALIEEVDGSQ